MKEYFKRISIVVLLLASVDAYSQKGYYEIEETMPFQPMLSIGSGFYSFRGMFKDPNLILLEVVILDLMPVFD